MGQSVPCTLVVNVSTNDVTLVRSALPHLLRTHKAKFSDVVVLVDETSPTGRLTGNRSPCSLQQLRDELATLRKAGLDFREVALDLGEASVRGTFEKWFGTSRVSLRCAGGTPIYAFLFGLEQAKTRYRLHVDSDMLFFDPGPNSWIAAAIAVLERHDRVIFVTQMMGPPALDGTDHEFLPPHRKEFGLRVSHAFSTRCFLYDDQKLQSFLPLVPARFRFPRSVIYRLMRGSAFKPLEQMIELQQENACLYRCALEAEFGFNLHAWNKAFFEDDKIQGTIEDIERGHVPDAQRGSANLLSVWQSPASAMHQSGGSRIAVKTSHASASKIG